jgi:hypothetical protein
MDAIESASAREKTSSCGRIVSQEEYDALMSELPLETTPDPPTPSEIAEKLRKLEFHLLILVGLTLGVIFVVVR